MAAMMPMRPGDAKAWGTGGDGSDIEKAADQDRHIITDALFHQKNELWLPPKRP
jgi:hypothetical protein